MLAIDFNQNGQIEHQELLIDAPNQASQHNSRNSLQWFDANGDQVLDANCNCECESDIGAINFYHVYANSFHQQAQHTH